MLCRALLAAVAISYLICVLLLSGIQKEDLDVSMLQKLQRHNVNINDLNNEEIRRQCLTQSTTESVTSIERIEKDTGVDNQHKTNINTFTETLPESDSTGKNVARTLKSDIDKVIRFFSDQKKILVDNINSDSNSNSRKVLTTQEYIQNDNTNMYTDIISTTARSTLIYTNMEQIIRLFNDQRKILEEKIKFNQESNLRKILTTQEYIQKDKNMEKIFNVHTIPTTENINEKLFIEYDKGQPKLDSIIRFWQMYVRNNMTNGNTRNIETENQTKASPKMLTDGNIYQINQLPQVTQNNPDNIVSNNYKENKYRDTKNSANTYNENNSRNSRTIENNFYLQNKYRQAQNNTNNYQENRNITLEYNENNYRTNKYTGFENNPNDNYGNLFREPEINVNNYRENVYGDFKINPVNYNQETRYTYQGNRYSEPQIYANDNQNNNRRYSENNSNYHQQKTYTAIQNNANNNNDNKYYNPKNITHPYYHEDKYTVTQNSHNSYRKINANNSENNESKEIDHISKLISTFLSKKRTKTDNNHNFKLSLVSEQLNSFLANNAHNPVKEDIVDQDQQYMGHERKSPLPYDVNNSKDKLIMDDKVYRPNNKNTHLNPVDTSDNKKELDNYEDYKTTYGSPQHYNYQQKVTDHEDKPDKTSYHQNEKPTEKYPKSIEKVAGNVSENDPTKHLTPEIVRQIAESIKEIVLKDLRRDIPTTSATSTTTTSATTTSVFTTISLAPTSLAPTTLTDLQSTTKELDLTKVQKASQAIEKFIDLFEQFKSFREKTVETPEAKESRNKKTENIDEKSRYSVPINIMYQASPQMPALNPYGVKASLFSSPMKQSPMIVNPFVQKTNDHEPQPRMGQKQNTINTITKSPPQETPLIYTNPMNMVYQARPQMPAMNPYGVKASLFSSPIIQSPMIIHPFVQQAYDHEPQPRMGQKQNTINIITKTPPQDAPLININQLRPEPIVIQTDQNEIPPLVITLSQPLSINRNIVVSTEFPYFMNNADRQRWQYMTHYGRNPDTKDDIVNRKEMLNSYSNLDYTKRTRELDNPKHSGLSDKSEDWEAMFHSNKNDTGAKPNVFSYPYNIPHNLERDRGHPRDHNIRGYHERLESLGQWPQEQREENRVSKMTSRQQIPINMKVGSNYDDTHFRNFLMTQQKVNDMLESILAANIRPDDGPRSVESI